jgi:phenylacetate-CoA ligase
MLIIRGVNLFYTQVEEIIHKMESLSPNYRLIVEKKGSMDSVIVEVETIPGVDHTHADLSNQLKLKIKGSIGISMGVDIKPPNSIPRSQGGKLSRILDKR